MSKFKVGDRVRSVSDVAQDIKIGGVYTVTDTCEEDGFFCFSDDVGDSRTRNSRDYVLDAPAAAPVPSPIVVRLAGFTVTVGSVRYGLSEDDDRDVTFTCDGPEYIFAQSDLAPLHALLGAYLASKAS